MTDTRDITRRYLVTVGPYPLPGEPQDAHLALIGWETRLGMWLHGQAICGRTVPQGEMDTGVTATCPECLARQTDYELLLANDPQELQQAYTRTFKQLPREAVAELLATMARDPQITPTTPAMLAASLIVFGHGMGWITEPPKEA